MKLIELLKSKLKEKQKLTIILDTSAFESKEAMQVIKEADKVILLSGIIEEMDDHKKDKGLFGHNIREISRKSREDEKSEKYVCVAGYEKHTYNDKNILDYCKHHKKTVIVTCDNNLCNHAKAYGIHYMYLEGTENEKKEKKKQQRIVRQMVSNVKYKEEKLYLHINKNNKKFFLYRKGVLLNTTSKNKIKIEIELEVGDIIYMIKNSREVITLMEYEIQVISEYNYAFCKNKELIESCKSDNVKENNFPKEVQDQIFTFLNPKPKTVEPETVKTNLEENKEIHFYNKWIRVSGNKDYRTEVKVERNGKLIKIQDYQRGDYLYILRYNMSNQYVQINAYEIVVENNKYKVRNIEEQRVYYVNEIYKLNFSEELKDAIRQFLITNIGY